MFSLIWKYITMLRDIIRGGGAVSAHRRLAKKQAKRILSELRILKFTAQTKNGLDVVRFESPLLLTREELWCPIDLKHRPAGISTDMFRSESVLKSLEDRCHAAVRIETMVNGKICYVVRLAGATFPEMYTYSAAKIPTDAPPLAFSLGVDERGQQRWINLATLPHLLVIGSTGKGKSNFIHQMLATFISRNSADDAQIWLADHKGGVELDRYNILMGSKTKPGIVRRFSRKPEQTLELLEAAEKEMTRRLDLLRRAGASDADDYRQQTGEYMPPIAIIIDEIFFLMLNKEKIEGKHTVSQWAENLFSRIASAGRAPGIHLIIATQKIGKDVLTSLITANFESRIVFAVSDMYQSIYIVGNNAAVGLPRGRMIFRAEGGNTTEVQTPRITPNQTRLLINRIARYGPDGGLGRRDEQQRFIDDAKLLLLAASETGGDFGRSRILANPNVRGVISRDRFDEIMLRLERDGVVEPGGPRRARKVARGYLARPQLLDVLYADDIDNEPVPNQHSNGMRKKPEEQPQQIEADKDSQVWVDLGNGMEISVEGGEPTRQITPL